jgi:putative transposase
MDFFDEALPRMERVLKIALLRRGVPQAVYVDNGQVYSSLQFNAACATLGIERIQAAPYSPEGKGKQERFFETLRLQFLPEVEASNLTTLTELNQSLWAYLELVYHQREHSETHQTPWARYTAGLDRVRHADPETVRRAFLWREQRKVRRDATISLQGNRYQVETRYAARTLELRFDPFDLSQIELYLDGTPLGLATVLVQNRQRHLAVEHLATEPPDPPKPKSSLDYLAALRAEYHAQQWLKAIL